MSLLKEARKIDILRRYFVINSFDGAITLLGILLGSFYIGVESIKPVLAAGLGAAVAMCISGMSGAYLIEKAEKTRELRELEKAMAKSMEKTRLGRTARTAPFLTGFVHGFSPLAVSIIILLPFIFGGFFAAKISALYYSSFAICAVFLFLMGLFMGRLSGTGMLNYGIKTLLVGAITAAILLLLKLY